MREGVWKPQDITLKLISKEANADMRRLPGPVVVGIVGSGYASYLHCKGYERVGKIDVRLKTICDVDVAKGHKVGVYAQQQKYYRGFGGVVLVGRKFRALR